MNIVLASAQKIENLSLAISITTIVLLFIFLASCLFLYYRYYRKCIDNYLEDSYIKNEIKGENKKFFKKFETLKENQELTINQKLDEYNKETLVEYIEKRTIKKNTAKVISNIVLVIFYLVLAAVIGFAIAMRASNDKINIGNSYYVVILTGSMEEKEESNSYLTSHNLNNQIETYSLIGLENITDDTSLELYDIVAYYNSNDQLIVHRIVEITYSDTNQALYTLRGDANPFSSEEESNLTRSQIVGKYNGFHNFGLGITINYLKSNLGIIAVSFGLLLIMIFDYFDIYLGKRILLRKKDIYPILDEENIQLLKDSPSSILLITNQEVVNKKEDEIENDNQEDDISNEVNYSLEDSLELEEEKTNQEEAIDEEDDEDSLDSELETSQSTPTFERFKRKRRKKMVPLTTRLKRCDLNLKNKYDQISNYALSYGLHQRISTLNDTYRLHKVRYIVITLRGKALVIHFKLDAKDYIYTTIPVRHDDKLKYQDVPTEFKVKSELSLKRAFKLIDDTMKLANIKRKDIDK